jgi:hypothetical protein
LTPGLGEGGLRWVTELEFVAKVFDGVNRCIYDLASLLVADEPSTETKKS